MIDLIAISYKNIGPFQNTVLSIFFNNGKMLIKAPIGTGKSFLFFDGPIYGLYKYSSRNILNTKSKEGFIKIIIEVDGIKYLITRIIKKSKVKESCESKAYKLEGNLPNFQSYQPIEKGIDIEELITKTSNIKREEIIFKNETNLQQQLQSILPPKEVITNTIFLMQDSENIFELSPIERLTILKNVFNLLGIDEAKEILAEKKREIRYKIKSKTDTSSYDKKLQNNIQAYLALFKTTKQLLGNNIDTQLYTPFFNQRTLISDKITINEFSLNDFPKDRENKLQIYIEQQKTYIQKLQHQYETIQEQLKEEQKKLQTTQEMKNTILETINNLETKIASNNEKYKEEIQQKKAEIIKKITGYETQIPKTKIQTFINKGLYTYIKEESDITLPNIYLEIQSLINKGKTLHETQKNIQAQIQNDELLIKNEKEKIQTQIHHLQEKILLQEEQLKNSEHLLKELEKNIAHQATFKCEKIQANCPFIKIINKKTFEQLEGQKASLLEQQNHIKNTIDFLHNEIKKLTTLEIKHDTKKREELEKQLQETKNIIEIIKEYLHEINYKNIENIYQEYITHEKELRDIEKKITIIEEEIKKIEERKIQIQKAIIQKESLEKQIEIILQTIQEKESQKKQLEKEMEQLDTETLAQIEKNHLAMKQIHHDLELLINDIKEHQLEVQKLQEQEYILGNLYTIFSKELLLLVLQDHLPILNDIINSYLAQVVDYQINMHLNKSNSEKLELEAKIIDSKGERDIKSLSGGQRIILKLTRMLATSSYINSPILFLDETINNLDMETIGKVSELLESFIKQRTIKLYTITHNQQIQEMEIRDQIIDLNI